MATPARQGAVSSGAEPGGDESAAVTVAALTQTGSETVVPEARAGRAAQHATRHIVPGGHYPALDGVRGVAVLAVVAVHGLVLGDVEGLVGAMTAVAAAGGLGVDLFFVLSGLLITGILLRTPQTATGVLGFYARRMLRTWPLYYLVLALAVFVLPATAIYAGTGTRDLVENKEWFLLHVSNLLIAWRGAWSAGHVSHFWSLAVEEQFYLVWPAVVMLVGGRRLGWACVVMIAVGAAARAYVWAAGWGPAALLVFTPCRLDALGWGSLAAWAVWRDGDARRWRPMAWAAVGLGVGWALGCCAVLGQWPPGDEFQVYGMWSANLAFAGWVYLMLTPGRLAGSVLGRGVLPWFGRYSFGLYVLHQFLKPVFDYWTSPVWWALTLGSREWGSLAYAGMVLVVSTVAAVASYHLFEAKWLELKHRFGDRGRDRGRDRGQDRGPDRGGGLGAGGGGGLVGPGGGRMMGGV